MNSQNLAAFVNFFISYCNIKYNKLITDERLNKKIWSYLYIYRSAFAGIFRISENGKQPTVTYQRRLDNVWFFTVCDIKQYNGLKSLVKTRFCDKEGLDC